MTPLNMVILSYTFLLFFLTHFQGQAVLAQYSSSHENAHTHWHKDLNWAGLVGKRHFKEPLERLKKPQQIHRASVIAPHQHTLFSWSLEAQIKHDSR